MNTLIHAILMVALLTSSFLPFQLVQGRNGAHILPPSHPSTQSDQPTFQEPSPTETPIWTPTVEATSTIQVEDTPTPTATVTEEPIPTNPSEAEPTATPTVPVDAAPTDAPTETPTATLEITPSETPTPADIQPTLSVLTETPSPEATLTPIETLTPQTDDIQDARIPRRVKKNGGQIRGLSDKVKVTFPDGALDEDVDVWIRRPVINEKGGRLSDRSFEIVAEGVTSKKGIRQFKKSITIQVAYDENAFSGAEQALVLFYYDEAAAAWMPLPSWVDTENNVLYARSDHLTIFDYTMHSLDLAQLPSLKGFEISQFTGAATYSYPFQLPPGPGGLQPSLTLTYNSQVVDGATETTQASWVGMGWSLQTGAITRNLNGTPDYLGDDTFTMTIGTFSSLLVPGADGYYHTQEENYWRIKKNADDTWTAWDKTGTKYSFGGDYPIFAYTDLPYELSDPNKKRSEASYPMYDFSSCSSFYKGQVRWLYPLIKVENPFTSSNPDNFYLYTYYYDKKSVMVDGATDSCDPHNRHFSHAFYPQSILYPGRRIRVHFILAPRTDYHAPWETAKYRVMYQARKLSEIRIERDANGDGTFEQVLYSYALTYGSTSQIFPGIVWTKGGMTATLTQIQLRGSDGSGMPATQFFYGDAMHLTKATNGSGGEVSFDYEATPWYASDVWEDDKIKDDFMARQLGRWGGDIVFVGHSNFYEVKVCEGAYESEESHDPRCPNPSIPGEAYRWFHSGFDAHYLRPGQVYRLIGNMTGSGIHVGLRSQDWVQYKTGSDNYFVLPSNASKVEALVKCNDCRLYDFVIQKVLTRYRVAKKTIKDTVTNKAYSFSYLYEGARANDHGSLDGTCPSKVTRNVCINQAFREFMGHSKVTEIGPDGRKMVTEFYQVQESDSSRLDYARLGNVKKIEVQDANNRVLQSTLYDYQYTTPPTSTDPAIFPHKDNAPLFTDLKIYWSYPVIEENFLLGDSGQKTGTRKEYNYDPFFQAGAQFGNLTHQVVSHWNGSTWVDYRLKTWRFFPNNTASVYLTGLPAYENQYTCSGTFNGACFDVGMGSPTGDRLLSSFWYLYDGSTTYNTPPSAGRLTGNRTFLYFQNPSTFSDPIYQDVRYEYDTWGNKNRVTHYTVEGPFQGFGVGGAQTTTAEFDAIYHSRLVKVTNALNQSTSYTYSGQGDLCGQPSSETGPNGSPTTISYSYDAFCRLLTVVRPGDSSTYPTIKYLYTNYAGPSAPASVSVTTRINAGDQTSLYQVRSFYNGLGWLIQQSSNSRVGTVNTNLATDYAYDAYGRVVKQTVPRSTPLSGYVSQDFTQPTSESSYDLLGRLVEVKRPDGEKEVRYAYAVQNSLLKTTITDAKGYATWQLADAWGRIVEVHPPTGPWTKYIYDARDLLTRVEQYQSDGIKFAETRMEYNGAGRKTKIVDPDLGTWQYTYDALGNLTRQTDARGQRICLYYDQLNRLLGKVYRTDDACPTTNPPYNVRYGYDQVVSGQYNIGLRTSMIDASGSTAWGYDARGRLIQESQTITGAGVFLTQWGYNSADQVNWIRYPGGNHGEPGETVSYTYTPQITVNTVTGANPYVVEIQYDEAGRVDLRKLGGTLASPTLLQDYTFYAWTQPAGNPSVGQGGRLNEIKAGPPSAPTSLVHFSYVYDQVGNILSLADFTLGSTQTQTFHYDTLHRLVDAQAVGGSAGAYPLQTYQYDTRGNLIQNGNVSLMYGAQSSACPAGALNKPHAVIGANGNAYCYDQNGNQTKRTLEASTNLVANPSFETNTNWTESRSIYYPGTSFYRGTTATASPSDGSYAYAISNHTYGYLESDLIAVTENTQYELYAYVRGEIDAEDSEGGWLIRAFFYDSSNNPLPAPNQYINTASGGAGTLTTSWQKKGGQFTTPAETAKLQVQLYSYRASGWVAFDDVELKKVGSSTNLVVNPGFESAGNWVEKPSPYYPATAFWRYMGATTGGPRSGSYGYVISNHAFGYLLSDPISASANTQYDLSAWLRGEIDAEGSEFGGWGLSLCTYQGSQYISCIPVLSGGAGTVNLTWQQKSGVVTTPAGTDTVRVQLVLNQTSGWVNFDDVVLKRTGTSTNLLPNPGFETASGWAEVRYAGAQGTAFYRSNWGTARAHSGSYGYSISNQVCCALVSDAIPVTPNTAYDLYAQVRGELDADDSEGGWALQVNFYDSQGVALPEPNNFLYVDSGGPESITPTWQIRGGRFTTPAQAAQIRVLLYDYLTSGWVSFDDVRLKNVLENQTQTLTYDPENRLVGVSGAVTASFVYDGDGQRVKSVVGGATTYSIHDFYEVERPDTLSLSVESTGASANGYTYRTFDATTTYTIQPDDVLEFDVYLDSHNPEFQGGFDAVLSVSGTVRDHSGWVDQNGKGIHPGADLQQYAAGQWYHREFAIGNKAGETLSNFKIAHEGNRAGYYVILLDNVRITNNEQEKIVIYKDGFPSASSQAEGPTADVVFQSTLRATSYYLAGGSRVALRRAGYREDNGLHFLLTDHLGSTTVATDWEGNQVSKQLYGPWGTSRYVDDTLPTPFQYTGQRNEHLLGLYDYRARWYDPYITQFTQPDSIIPDPYNPLDWNRYAYARYNPVNNTDPTGHYVAKDDPFEDYTYADYREHAQKYYGVTFSDDIRKWGGTDTVTIVDSLMRMNRALDGNLRDYSDGAKLMLDYNSKEGGYFGFTSGKTITFYTKNVVLPYQNVYHEFGHLLNNATGAKLETALNSASVYTKSNQFVFGRKEGVFTRDDSLGYKLGTLDEPLYPTPPGVQAQQHPDPTSASENWADMWANYVAANIDLGSEAGRLRYDFVRSQLGLGGQ